MYAGIILATLSVLFFFWLFLWRFPVLPSSLTRECQAYFEWDSASGFKTFRVETGNDGKVGGRLWQYLVALQVKPRLDSYLRQPGWQRLNGYSTVTVAKIIPIAYPTALGSDGEILYDPDETPLMHAADKGATESVKELLATVTDVNARDQRGQTALIHACLHGQSNSVLIRALLAAGADVNATDRGGRTPLLLAVQTELPIRGMPRRDGAGVVRELLAAHANVNAKDEKGLTALMMAAKDAEIDTVQELLRSGADVNARNNEGQTALSLAETKGRTAIVQVLRQSGATGP